MRLHHTKVSAQQRKPSTKCKGELWDGRRYLQSTYQQRAKTKTCESPMQPRATPDSLTVKWAESLGRHFFKEGIQCGIQKKCYK